MNRLKTFFVKIVSVKGAVFILATVAFFQDKLPWYGWLASAAFVVGFRFVEKFFKLGFWKGK